MSHDARINITEIPVSNEKLYTEVARMTKENRDDVQSAIEFVGTFVAATISSGMMQSVMIPYFGKFKPKVRMLRAIKEKEMMRLQGISEMVKAIKGKKPGPSEKTLKYKKIKDETIRAGRKQAGAAEQGMDRDDTGTESAADT